MTKRVLAIDDEPDITTYYNTLLTDNGWEVHVANSGDDGINLAKEQTPDIVILDVMMPDRGGLSTLVALRKLAETKDVPVVLVTGIQDTVTQDFRAYLDRFKHYPPNAYLEKPIDADLLLSTLEKLTR